MGTPALGEEGATESRAGARGPLASVPTHGAGGEASNCTGWRPHREMARGAGRSLHGYYFADVACLFPCEDDSRF